MAFALRKYAAWNIAITLYWSTFKLCLACVLLSAAVLHVGSNTGQRMEEALAVKPLQISGSKVGEERN